VSQPPPRLKAILARRGDDGQGWSEAQLRDTLLFVWFSALAQSGEAPSEEATARIIKIGATLGVSADASPQEFGGAIAKYLGQADIPDALLQEVLGSLKGADPLAALQFAGSSQPTPVGAPGNRLMDLMLSR